MPQTLASLSIAVALLIAAEAATSRVRRTATIALLCALAVAMVALPFGEATFNWIGDYRTYTRNRETFLQYVSPNVTVRFSSHLAYLAVYWVDRLLGANETSYEAAFRVLSNLGGIATVTGLLILAWLEGWSARSTRFAALVALAPATLAWFGYREIATLSLCAIAYPLLARGLRGNPDQIVVAGALFGIGFAFHGFGVLAIVGGALAILAAAPPLRQRVRELTGFALAATAASAGWLLLYLAVFHLRIVPHHAGEGLLFRSPFETYVALGRLVPTLFSAEGVRAALWALAAQGTAIVLLLPFAWRLDRAEAIRALAFSLPGIAFTSAFFFAQGVALEMDLVFSAFPGVFALAWAVSPSSRLTAIGLALFVASHVAFWFAFGELSLVNQML